MSWQDIETAPKDGRPIMVWADGFEWPEIIRWFDYDEESRLETGEEGYWHYAEELLRDVTDTCCEELTHWMPLPDPPFPPKGFIRPEDGGVAG